jgi:hypothetical protein
VLGAPIEDEAHGPLGLLGQRGGEQRLGARAELGAEAAAHELTVHAHLRTRHTQGLGHVRHHAGDALRGGPDLEPALGRGRHDRAVRLEAAVGLHLRAEHQIHRGGGGLQGGVHVARGRGAAARQRTAHVAAHRDVIGRGGVHHRRARSHRRLELGHRGLGRQHHFYRADRVPRLVHRVGRDRHQLLPLEAHAVTHLHRGVYGAYARHRRRAPRIQALHLGAGVR